MPLRANKPKNCTLCSAGTFWITPDPEVFADVAASDLMVQSVYVPSSKVKVAIYFSLGAMVTRMALVSVRR